MRRFIGSIKDKTAFLLCAFLLIFSVNAYADNINIYKPLTAAIPVSFRISGSGTATCEAIIEVKDNSPKLLQNTLMFEHSGKAEFNIQFTEPGTYKYVIYQKKGVSNKISYDATVFEVTLFVTENTSYDNELTYVITAVTTDSGKKSDQIEFVNEIHNATTSGGGGSPDKPSGDESSNIDKPRGDDSSSTDTPDIPEITNQPNNGTDNLKEPRDESNEQGKSNDDTIPRQSDDVDITYNDETITEQETETVLTDTTVETGDSSRQGLWIVLMCASLAVIVLTVVVEKE